MSLRLVILSGYLKIRNVLPQKMDVGLKMPPSH